MVISKGLVHNSSLPNTVSTLVTKGLDHWALKKEKLCSNVNMSCIKKREKKGLPISETGLSLEF